LVPRGHCDTERDEMRHDAQAAIRRRRHRMKRMSGDVCIDCGRAKDRVGLRCCRCNSRKNDLQRQQRMWRTA
jgi:hypothetical protein